MTNPKSRIFAAVAGALSVGAVAWAAEPTAQEARIQQLEAKLAALETQQAANSKDVAATIDSVLRDAERRSQLLATSGDQGAGYDSGFYIRAGEGWVLRPGLQFQFRNVTDYREDGESLDGDGDDDGGDDDIDNGFEVRRMKLELSGTAFTKDLEYAFSWATNRSDGGLTLEDAFVKYMFSDDWGFRAGQYKDPVHHEELTSSKRQLAADRSLVNEVLGGGVTDRVQGASLIYGGYQRGNRVNAEVAVHDGINSDNTNFRDHALDDGANADFGIGARVEFLAVGDDWRPYRDFTAMGNKGDILVLGAGADWTQVGDDNLFFGTIDAQWENSGGLGIYGAVLLTHADGDAASSVLGIEDDGTNWGGVLQAGYMLNEQWELFGRGGVIVFDEEIVAVDEDTFWELTVGVNYYLGQNGSAGHRAKVTVDVTWLPDGAGIEDTGLGIGGATDQDEFVIRGQFQLLI